jgi:hypothetical protein
MMQSVDTRIMSIDPAPLLHRFVSLATSPTIWRSDS